MKVRCTWRTLPIWPSMRCILWTSFWTSSLKHILCVVYMLWKCIKHQTMSLSSRNKSALSTRVQDWWQVPRNSSDCVDTRSILFEMMCGYYPTADDLHTISESTWYRPGLSQGEVISKEQRGAILIAISEKSTITSKRASIKHKLIIRRVSCLFSLNAARWPTAVSI